MSRVDSGAQRRSKDRRGAATLAQSRAANAKICGRLKRYSELYGVRSFPSISTRGELEKGRGIKTLSSLAEPRATLRCGAGRGGLVRRRLHCFASQPLRELEKEKWLDI